ATGRTTRYGYDLEHRLTVVSAPEGENSSAIRHGVIAQVSAVKGDLGSAQRFAGAVTTGGLRSGATDRYAFAVRESELRSTATEAVLIGVEVESADGLMKPGAPGVMGLTPLATRVENGRAFALFAVARAGLHVLEVTGRNGTFGGYAVRMFVVGDVNADGAV